MIPYGGRMKTSKIRTKRQNLSESMKIFMLYEICAFIHWQAKNLNGKGQIWIVEISAFLPKILLFHSILDLLIPWAFFILPSICVHQHVRKCARVSGSEREWAGVSGSEREWAGVSGSVRECAGVCRSEREWAPKLRGEWQKSFYCYNISLFLV